MNERIKKLEKQCWDHQTNHWDAEKSAELIVQECVNAMLNTDEQKFVVEIEGWELGGANHGAWERGILDAVATVKEHFGVKE